MENSLDLLIETLKYKRYGDGYVYWVNDREEKHREDGPAVEYSNGTKEWWVNGQCHREDGPAIEFADGTKYWYRNGKRHREDGPAIEYPNGVKEWYINGLHTIPIFILRINIDLTHGLIV